jgi:hypothetical protein
MVTLVGTVSVPTQATDAGTAGGRGCWYAVGSSAAEAGGSSAAAMVLL